MKNQIKNNIWNSKNCRFVRPPNAIEIKYVVSLYICVCVFCQNILSYVEISY